MTGLVKVESVEDNIILCYFIIYVMMLCLMMNCFNFYNRHQLKIRELQLYQGKPNFFLKLTWITSGRVTINLDTKVKMNRLTLLHFIVAQKG